MRDKVINGEYVFLKSKDVAIIEIPLSHIEPSLFESEMEGMEEDEGALVQYG